MGRIRQAKRMSDIADAWIEEGHHVIADFICPTLETRKIFKADYTIWMNTINAGRFADTNKMFEKPINVNFEVSSWNEENHKIIAKEIESYV